VITALSHSTIWVLDQDEALAFYTERLGFEVHTDATMDDFRWLTVNAPDRPDHELVLEEQTVTSRRLAPAARASTSFPIVASSRACPSRTRGA
jgi:catechol 2,3-dioxygenase-like lactoylglutathione lyase family enzyme